MVRIRSLATRNVVNSAEFIFFTAFLAQLTFLEDYSDRREYGDDRDGDQQLYERKCALPSHLDYL